MIKRQGKYTFIFGERPKIIGEGSIVGPKEFEGPLGKYFHKIAHNPKMGFESWEEAESALQREALQIALSNARCKAEDIDFVFAGDLLNQCISSSFGLKTFSIPYLGQYGACSTMAQTLIMGAIAIESGAARYSASVTSSHFCSAERQYRMPLEYGGQRTPTAQWTVTGSGCCILGKESKGTHPRITAATVGKIIDLGVKDANNMGAAMAPAAADTLASYFEDTATRPEDYKTIYTGDLGAVGSELLYELLEKKGIDIKSNHRDCGMMIFQRELQDVHAGGSGCGCAASVLCGHILHCLRKEQSGDILFIATGALMSPTSSLQGQSIPCIAHLLRIKME